MKASLTLFKLILPLFFIVLLLPAAFSECVPSWSCDSWTVCYKGSQSQTCRSSCGSPSISYELRSCGEVIVDSAAEEAPASQVQSMTGMSLSGFSNSSVFVYAILADVILLVLGIMTWKWKYIEPHFKGSSKKKKSSR